MELRTRFLPKLLNSEVDEYLKSNDIIIVPVGTVEMHGGLPLDLSLIHISEPTRLGMISYAVFCLKKKNKKKKKKY